jgi:hypothetical protein
MDTLMQTLEQDPLRPRQLNPQVDPDLEAICLKCLEKQPANRYPSADLLADDLERYRSGEAVAARSSGVLGRLARALSRSQHDVQFRTWGTMLFWFGAIVLAVQTTTFALTWGGPPYPVAWLVGVRGAQFVLMAAIFLAFRGRAVMPRSAAERQLWAVWGGYLIGCGCAVLAWRMMGSHGAAFDELTLYPYWAVLSATAFMAMGAGYWGRCYALGAGFFVLAVVMPFWLPGAPLLFGLAWAGALTAIGLHLRRLSRSDPDEGLATLR